MKFDNKGLSVALDQPSQVEYNRRKNIDQDKRLDTLSSQVNQILEQAPAGFLPRVYYGLERGNTTYRFPINYKINISVDGNIGDAYSLNNPNETDDYIAAVAVKEDENTLNVIIQGDYTIDNTTFTALNMRTGQTTENIPGILLLQEASYLGDYPAELNKEKQITALVSIEFDRNNVVFASIDYNSDGIYNWVRVGGYLNGKDGNGIYTISSENYETILSKLQNGDILLATETFERDSIGFDKYFLYTVDIVSPLTVTSLGSIKGEKGDTGDIGATGATGNDGITPHIQDNYWYIGTENTNVKAIGTDGEDGENGQSFNIQSGLFSTPDNYGKPNNVTPEGEALNQLPSLPQTDITGKGYIVFDPLTTPLEPYYDLYWANNGDTKWTIIHPFSGLKGQDGKDGYTPYIKDNTWYINNNNLGVPATGPQGPQGTAGVGVQDAEVSPKSGPTDGNWYDLNFSLTNGDTKYAGDFEAPRGPRGKSVKEIYNSSDRESMGYTITTLVPELEDGTKLPSFEIRAKNGEQGPAADTTLKMIYDAKPSNVTFSSSTGVPWQLRVTNDENTKSFHMDLDNGPVLTSGKTYTFFLHSGGTNGLPYYVFTGTYFRIGLISFIIPGICSQDSVGAGYALLLPSISIISNNLIGIDVAYGYLGSITYLTRNLYVRIYEH